MVYVLPLLMIDAVALLSSLYRGRWSYGTNVLKLDFVFFYFAVQATMAKLQFLSIFMILVSWHYVDGQG